MIRRTGVSVLVLATLPAAVAPALQLPPADSAIRLGARVFTPPAGIDTATLRLARATPRGTLHVLVQFLGDRQSAVSDALASNLGVRWIRPVTNRLSWAVVRADTAVLRSLAARVRWVGSPRPTDKFERGAVWASAGGATTSAQTAIVVQFFGDVGVGDQQSRLTRHGAQRIKRVDPINAWLALVPRDSIVAIAGDDGVQWIEAAPRAPGYDNDKVRAASGVNADAVLAPSAYALSGNGITVGYWDGAIPSVTHADFGGRVVAVDAPNPLGRNSAHMETGLPNGQYDVGESMYIDVDDSRTVTANDWRYVAAGLTTPLATDVGKALALFNRDELYVDQNGNGVYNLGEPIYRDADADGKVATAADVLLTANAGVDGDQLTHFFDDLHAHATMVLGSMLGSGTRSLAESGTPFQWKGVAPSATARAYAICDVADCWKDSPTIESWLADIGGEAVNALNAGAFIHAHPWGPRATYCILGVCYSSISQIFDSYASSRNFDGVSFGFPRDVLSIASAGNFGYPERHTETVAADGRFEAGESIYRDRDGDGVVSSPDELLHGPPNPIDTQLADFRLDERHTFAAGDSSFVDGQSIYRDANGNDMVDPGDDRLTTVGALAPGTVTPADADATTASSLRRFIHWFTVRGGNSAKNTLQVGTISSDAVALHAFSGRGPTLDGRLKPDLVAAGAASGGNGIRTPSPRNTYGEAAGTSMSVGVSAGAAALIAEWYKTACLATGPAAATLRALMIHGADDVVLPSYSAHAGPDFSSGFGRLRVKESVELVPHHVVGSVNSIASVTTLQVTVARVQRLKVTLAWSDVPRSLLDGPTDHGLLNNDLDLLLIAPDGTQYGPWITDASNPSAVASRSVVASGGVLTEAARDRRNTVEQVMVDDAQAGTWKIVVAASQLNFPAQAFTVVSEMLSPAVGPCANAPAADVWLKDNAADAGTTPSSGATWLSPDVWNRHAADGQTAHENPEHGQRNFLYVNLRNRSGVAVKATTVEVWLADASLGLSWPSNFTYVGRIEVANLGSSATRQVGPLEWNPPAPGAAGHFCLYIRVVSPQDGLTIVEGSSVETNAQTSNNITSRNLQIVDLMSEPSMSFLVRNTGDDAADVDVQFRIPRGLLAEGRVYVALSPALARRWTRPAANGDGFTTDTGRTRAMTPAGGFSRARFRLTGEQVTLSGFRLPAGTAAPMTISFSSTRETMATYDVDVVELIAGQVIGGIRYVVRTGRRR